MPCPPNLLERGAVCLALYPYTPGFPLDLVLREAEPELSAQLERHESIESISAKVRAQGPPEIAVTVKLRPVLLLQDGRRAGRQDITVVRVNSISEQKKARGPNWYKKLQSRIHPAHYLVAVDAAHGLRAESYVDLLALATIQKKAILQRLGALSDDEMRDVSEILLRTLELDISRYLQALQPPPEAEPEGETGTR